MFIYRPEYNIIEKPDYSALTCLPGQKPLSQDGVIRQAMPIGGSFVDVNGTEAKPCSTDVVFKYEDKIENMKDWLADYMGQPSKRDDTGYVGKWPDEKDLAHLYFYFDPTERKLYKFFFTLAPSTGSMTSVDGFLYFIEKDGLMYSAVPAPCDIIVEDPSEIKVLIEYLALCLACSPEKAIEFAMQQDLKEEVKDDPRMEGCSPEFEGIYRRQIKMMNESADTKVLKLPRIIFGFSGIGKTSFIKSNPLLNIVDYDDPKFPKETDTFFKYIQTLKPEDIVLGWTGGTELMEDLAKKNITFEIVLPQSDRLKEFCNTWIKRDIDDGISKEAALRNVKRRVNTWKETFEFIDKFIQKYPQFKSKIAYLKKGQYLADYIKHAQS